MEYIGEKEVYCCTIVKGCEALAEHKEDIMSLSEAPAVKITYNTAQDISDEILGSAIQFCRNTAYKQNLLMLTYFWTAFLFSVQEEIVENGLLESVKNCYISSLSSILPKLLEDDGMRKNVEETRESFWEEFLADFSNLSTESEVAAFLQKANELNNEGGEASAYPLKADAQKVFSGIAYLVSSNVSCIMRQSDNSYLVQYRGILDDFRGARRIPSRGEKPSSQSTQGQHSADLSALSRKKLSPLAKRTIVVLAIVAGILLLSHFLNTPNTELEPVAEPKSGMILAGAEVFNESTITVSASSGEACVVKLKTPSGTTRLSFYVRAGDVVTIGVPHEYLYVYFASGDIWYGQHYLFGEDTSYSMDDEICNFIYPWEYILYPVNGGNFSQTPIEADEF